MALFGILILSHSKEGVDASMRKDITIEKIMLGGEKVNKSELARQYGCCWRTIDKRLNPEKYYKEKKIRTYTSKLDPYKNIIDEKIENNNIPATGIYFAILCRSSVFNIYNEYACSNGYIDIILFKNSNLCKNSIMLEFKYMKQRDYSKNLFNKIKEEGTNQLREYAKDERIDDNTRKYLLIYVGSKLKLLEEV